MKPVISRKIKESVLAGGGSLYFFPFGNDGVVTVVGSVSGGHLSAQNPILADVHSAMLTEGTRQTSKKAIQEKLDSLGVSVSFVATQNRLQFTIRCREDTLEATVSLAGEMLSVPTFPTQELAIIKKHFEGALAAEAENTRAQAGISFANLVYEKKHPNRADTTKEKRVSLKKITRAELLAYHKAHHGRATLVVSASGDADMSAIKRAVEKSFSGLPKNSASVRLVDGKEVLQTGGTEVVHIKGKASIDYMLGTRLYIKKNHPDYPALVLGARILGNRGFTGRLMKVVREKEGLTYGIYAYLEGMEAGADGDLLIWGTFAPSLFQKGRASTKRELSKFLKNGFDTKEFKIHQNLMLANWYVNLSNTGALASAMHTAVIESGGVGFLDSFPESIRKLTLNEVQKALKVHIDIDQFTEVASGTVDRDALSS